MSERVSITTPDGDMPAHVWRPEAGQGPGILLIQEIFGISRYIERRAQDLADLGYVVVAPELFWRLGVSRVDEGPDSIEKAFGLLHRLDWASAVQDAERTLDALAELPEVSGGVGIVGFCLGGGLGFNVAAGRSPDVLVSYYGSGLPELLGLAPPEPGVPVLDPASVTAASLHHFGLADSFLSRPTVEKIRDTLNAFDQVDFETYEGADHAFDNDDFHLYDADASALAWKRTAEFLRTRLPVPA
jgi:carboxymethylenebutenolidase